MFLFVVLAAAIIVAVLIGGDVRRLSHVRLDHPEFLIAAFLTRAVVAVLGTLHAETAVSVAQPLNIVVGVLLLVFVWLNRQLPGALLFGAGEGMNLIALISFAGRMPVVLPPNVNPNSPHLSLLTRNLDPLHVLLQDPSGLWFLGDIFSLAILGRTSVVSIGDVLMALAVGWLVIRCSQRVPRAGAAYGSSPTR